ncbi:MAG: hypothetical protein WC384_18330 [Prolixibacteraceae bacterium]|jgi:hypothetical protein
MTFLKIYNKAKRKFWSKLVSKTMHSKIYPYIYRSYWHLLFNKSNSNYSTFKYFTAQPNPGAGIGHQIANWIAGYWYSMQFGLNFAHIPFAHKKWDDILGFGENEVTTETLIKEQGFKKVLLPLFDESNIGEIERTKKIIDSYRGERVVFVAEQDQPYRDQFGVMNDIKYKFHHAKSRKEDRIIYERDTFNIAIHIRRGDIEIEKKNNNPNLLMRWQDNNYFINILSKVVENLKTEKTLAIYLFSQGNPDDFFEFNKFENIHYCLDMSAQDSFVNMVFADLLITSKSSFSYKPALLSNGIKICPKDFWHGYPTNNQWILVKKDGSMTKTEFAKLKMIDF